MKGLYGRAIKLHINNKIVAREGGRVFDIIQCVIMRYTNTDMSSERDNHLVGHLTLC
jgi:hypothetical protein